MDDNMFIVSIKNVGISFAIKADDESNAKTKAIDFIKFNKDVYSYYQNINKDKLIVTSFDRLSKFLKNSICDVLEIGRFGN